MKKDKNIKEIQEIKEDKTIIRIRAITRSVAFLMPIIALIGAIFYLPESEILQGALISTISGAAVFYFKDKD